jgi:two-component system CheB/CheR fusion protein
LARNALLPVSSTPPRSGVLIEGSERGREIARELQADNDELRETNRQLIAAMEEIQSLNVTLQSVNEALHTTNVELRSELDQLRARGVALECMLNGIDMAVLLLSEGLELRDYNAAAARFFTLKRQDIGRPIGRVRHDFVQLSLAELCHEALDTGEPLERITSTSSGDLVSLRVREVDLGASLSGLLLTITEITDLGLDPQSHFT